MRPKAAKGLTAKGRRMGRPPGYLREDQIACPLPALKKPKKARVRRIGSSDTRTIIKKKLAEARLGPALRKQVAAEVHGQTSATGAALDRQLDATAQRLRRVEAEGVDRISSNRKPKRSQITSKCPRQF
jgi:hypothetical protein